MAQVTVKIPRNTYLAVKSIAKKRGCFIGKIIADAVTLYNSQNAEPVAQPKQQAAD